ncbi:MAG: hypothetical protein QOJ19_214 [Acidimicrobiia bacterium]|jgi:hypothetical protein|nr:hypothetical protein [Acidimicrobiia bacterium]
MKVRTNIQAGGLDLGNHSESVLQARPRRPGGREDRGVAGSVRGMRPVDADPPALPGYDV